MSWEAVGALGEMIGAPRMIVTLDYLARQIRTNTRQKRAAMTQIIVDGVDSVHSAVMVNSQLADV